MTNYKISEFLCTHCTSRMYIPRVKKRKNNHIKDIYCFKCKTKRKFIEPGNYK